MITNSHPEGRKAAQDLMDGMIAVADMKNIGPDVVISANLSMLVWIAKQQTDKESHELIASGMRNALSVIESGQFPEPGYVVAASGALH